MDIIIAFSKYYDADDKINDLLLDSHTSASYRLENIKNIYSSDMIDINSDTEYAFKYGAKSGNLNVAKWAFESRLDAGLLHDFSLYASVFELSCEFDNLNIAQWLHQTLTESNLSFHNKILHSAFVLACKNGNMNVIKWLRNICPIVLVDSHEAFELSCINGHEIVAKWLIQIGAVSNKHVNETFVKTCKKGQLACAKLLMQFDINDNDKAFICACQNGHLQTAEWLYTIGKLSESTYNDAFIGTCRKGFYAIAVWLYSLGFVNFRINDDCVFKYSCMNKHADIAIWLANLCSDYVLKIKNKKIKKWKITKLRDQIKDKTDDEIVEFLNLKISHDKPNIDDRCFVCLDDYDIKFNCGHHCCFNCTVKWYIQQDREKKCELCKKPIDFSNVVIYKN